MPTEPKQDRNVEARADIAKATGGVDGVYDLGEMQRCVDTESNAAFRSGEIEPQCKANRRQRLLWSIQAALEELEAKPVVNSRPSQPPQNVEAGDAVKVVVEEFNKFISLWSGYHDDERLERCKGFAARLRLGLSATGDDAMRDLKPELQQGKTVQCGPFKIKTLGNDARDGDGDEIAIEIHRHVTAIRDDSTSYGNLAHHYEAIGQIVADHETRFIVASANAERLKVLEAENQQLRKSLFAWNCDKRVLTDPIQISPDPAQTPGDERQG